MSKKYELNVKPRSDFGKCASRRLRKAGMIPANIYEHGKPCVAITVDKGEWEVISKHEINLISLMQGNVKTMSLIKEIQVDQMKKQYLHLDFQAVKMDEKIHSSVPVHALVGEPVGVTHGGILEQPLHAIEVSCTPKDLPEVISVDISKLEMDHSLHVKDLVLPEGVVAVTSLDAVVFHIMKPSANEPGNVAAAEAEVAPAATATEKK